MRAVDLGAAPGGWTWQLVQRGLHVTAVDNGPLKGAIRDDRLVRHVRDDGSASRRDARSTGWCATSSSSPSRIADLVARLDRAKAVARRAIFNLKLPMKKRYDEVRAASSASPMRWRGVPFTLALRQLYHDREEVTGYVSCATR